jgi:hypothetical protein
MDKMVKDKADNTNNRFGVGSEINRRTDRRALPVLGLPAARHADHPAAQAHPRSWPGRPAGVPPRRGLAAKGPSIWKLYYNGSVGGRRS